MIPMVQETLLGFPAHTLPYRRYSLPRFLTVSGGAASAAPPLQSNEKTGPGTSYSYRVPAPSTMAS